MKTLALLAVVLVVLPGWSAAQTAEARIGKFVFNCDTLEGDKVKPKLGDIEGAVYRNLPVQRQQCHEEVQGKIVQCRENIDFGSETRNWELAECLPLFREQAQSCVGHFEQERAKCGGAAVTGTGRLDSGKRRRLQTALAAAGFDPGPADGQFGPKTRQAIQAWQRANGHAASGELTNVQVEALLGSAGSLEPLGPNWIVARNQPCQVHYSDPEPGETVTWTGGCVDGKAFGEGRLIWRGGVNESVYEGGMREGKLHGHGTSTWADGGRYEGDWRDGEQHGRGISIWANGSRYEGSHRDGKLHGHGTHTWASGNRYEGDWRDGKKNGRGTYFYAGDGSRYDGAWSDDARNGHGTLTFPNGSRYEGQWRDDLPNGFGTLAFPDGRRFGGQWRNGCFGDRHGAWALVATTAEACGFE